MIDKITDTIRERGLKQAEVERLCGLAENRISRWKDGQGEPKASQILRIADLLGVPVRFLIDDAMTSPEPDVTETQQRILWLAEQVGYDVAAKRMAMALDTEREKPLAAEGQRGAVDGSGSERKAAAKRAGVRVRSKTDQGVERHDQSKPKREVG